MSAQLVPLSEGFLLGLGLIVGLGPQNSFILQQGIRREFILTVVILASLIDLFFIALGVGGAGSYMRAQPQLPQLLSWVGVVFLFTYGWKSFKHMLLPQTFERVTGDKLEHAAVIIGVLGVSLLNPSVYLDTLFIIGGSAAQYAAELQIFFAAGAALASLSWFFALAFGAARLSTVLTRKWVRRSVEAFSGVIMWVIASRLLFALLTA